MVSDYKSVSKTFTYAFQLLIPLFLVYEVSIPLMGQTSEADMLLQKIIVFIGCGLIPQSFAFPFMMAAIIAGAIAITRYEQKKFGVIEIDPKFFLITLKTAVLYGLIVNVVIAFISSGYIAMPFAKGFSAIPSFRNFTVQSMFYGGGIVFEELLFRVMMLGSLLLFFQKIALNSFRWECFAVVISAILFAAFHYMKLLPGSHPDPLTLSSFIYRFLLGVAYGGLYIKKGLATTTWTHAMANIWVTSNII